MSAENWTQCPVCTKKFIKERAGLYGSVPEDIYLSEVDRVERAINAQNLREDYQIGIDLEGNFYVKYCGHCAICSFHYEFQTGGNVLPNEERAK
jgi:hypothetical protein